MPMGFTWSVVLAHDANRNIITSAYKTTSMSKTLPATHPPTFMCKADAPFILQPGTALAIIDDISILLNDCEDRSIKLFHRTLRTLLTAAGLPVAEEKLLPPTQSRLTKSPLSE